jgi:hypothetical protein
MPKRNYTRTWFVVLAGAVATNLLSTHGYDVLLFLWAGWAAAIALVGGWIGRDIGAASHEIWGQWRVRDGICPRQLQLPSWGGLPCWIRAVPGANFWGGYRALPIRASEVIET